MAKIVGIIVGVLLLYFLLTKFLLPQGGTLTISQPLNSSSKQNVALTLSNGDMLIDSVAGTSLTGESKYTGKKPELTYVNNNFKLSSTDQKKEQRTIHLPMNVKLDASISGGNGNLDLSLKDLDIAQSNVTLGNGNLKITVPGKVVSKTSITLGNGNLDLRLPKQLEGVRITFPENITVPELNFGNNMQKIKNGYQSLNFKEGKINAEILINAGNAQLSVNSVD